MTKFIFLITAFLFLGCNFNLENNPEGQSSCTLEAQICPDGSTVGRVPPNCEFEACPETTEVEIDNQEQKEPFTATFEIYTYGTKRIFSQPMYLNQSEVAYIANGENASTITILKAGTTWLEFFNTLPFTISTDCLITGTGQEFCSDEEGQLSFELNGIISSNALQQKINPEDTLIIKYQ